MVLYRRLLWKLWREDCHVVVRVEGVLVLVSWLLVLELLHATTIERLRWRSNTLGWKEGRRREARNGDSCLLLCS